MKRYLAAIAAGLLCLIGANLAFGYEALQGPTELLYWDKTKSSDGYTLFQGGGLTYLIDMEGHIVKSWPGGQAPRLLPNGDLLEFGASATVYNTQINEYTWDGALTWTYPAPLSHHNLIRIFNKTLQAETTIYINYQLVTYDQAVALGCDPAAVSPTAGVLIDRLTEVDMNKNVIWQWQTIDHGCQTISPTLSNYVSNISEHPEKINLNMPGWPMNQDVTNWPLAPDWVHFNSLDYNDANGQIVVNCAYGEFYVIDHDGTCASAVSATNIAAAAGPAGDFLYRFGDPVRYGQGDPPSFTSWIQTTSGHRQLGLGHDIQWIRPGLPGAGHFLIFNNDGTLFEVTPQSYIYEIDPYRKSDGTDSATYVNPPDAGYTSWLPPEASPLFVLFAQKNPKLLSNQIVWKYYSQDTSGFYSPIISSCQRLPNGNTLIDSGSMGHIFEVTSGGKIVWEYIVPVTPAGILKFKGDLMPYFGATFRVLRYGPNYSGLAGHSLTPGNTITGEPPNYVSPPSASAPVQDILTPAATDKVKIIVHINSGSLYIRQVLLIYSIAGVVNATQTMYDDGTHGDSTANDGNYTAEIPAFPAGTTVRYYVSVRNNMSLTVAYPSDAPSSTYSYTVSGGSQMLAVTPATGLNSSGTLGGPFSPASQIYTLTNNNTVSITWTAAKSKPWVSLSSAGGTLDASASITVTASINAGANTVAPGNYADIITFTDTTDSITATRSVALSILNTQSAPVLTSPGDRTVNENQVLSFTLAAYDLDSNIQNYSSGGLPTGATLNPGTGFFSWQPSYSAAEGGPASNGIYPDITFTVTDTTGLTDSRSITITVNNTPRPPILTSPGDQTVIATQSLVFTVSANDPDGGAIMFSAANLPANANFVTATGQFNWIPSVSQIGVYPNVTLTATNPNALSDSKAITITVQSIPAIIPPSNLVATALSTSQIILTWADNSNNEDSFKIERGVTNTAFSQIGQVSANITIFTDSGLTEGMTYYYRVRASNALNDSLYTAPVFATTSNTSSGSSGGGSSKSSKCGLMGIEALMCMGLIWLLRRRKK